VEEGKSPGAKAREDWKSISKAVLHPEGK